ncbi:MAG TPA: sulfur transferase domain-containing protein [Isosphaeraceae bacterium]|jgi:protein tyrosine phosphatase (PTP) superfamily phosphohydrolase (DUF442 family)|nr:sulfur transferase domain-containing protein [Isosphaeraceae bacterium]
MKSLRTTPGRSWITGRRLALLTFAVAALALDGCSMFGGGGGCSTCGKHRLFGRRRSAEVYAAPPAVEMPVGGVVTPGVTSPGVGSPTGGEMENNPDLSPLPGPAEPAGSGTGTGGSTQSRKPAGTGTTMSYPSNLRSRARRNSPGGQSLVRALPTFEPAPGPARRGTSAASATADDLLNDLPPPASDVSPPAAPAAETPAATTPPNTPSRAAATPANDKPVTTASATVEAPGAAPGIRRFLVVEPKLAGGSVPSAEGWAWLADKGYKTALDLREPAELKGTDIAAVSHHGLRYVALPIAAGSITEENVRQFDAEVAQAGARPLFFFDGDGARAAALWYVHLIAVGRMDARSARHEVEQVGRIDSALFASADRYLDKLAAGRRAATDPTPPSPTPAAETPAESSTAPTPAQAPTPTSYSIALRQPAPLASTAPTPAELSPWRTIGAMLLSALAVPLAFLGRSALGVTLRRRVRASLPAPAPTPSSARDGSDA